MNKFTHRLWILLVAITGMVMAVTAMTAPVGATGSTQMYFKVIYPPVIGSQLVVEVRINTLGDHVNAVESDFTYPSSILQFVSIDSASLSAFPTEAGSTGGSGTISLNRGVTGPQGPTGISGDYKVADITFNVKQYGLVPLVFQNTSQVDDASTNLNDLGIMINATYGDGATLSSGRSIASNGRLITPNGYKAVMQYDGNLVVRNPAGKVLWATGTPRHAGAHLIMQSDGNLVIRDSVARVIWASGVTRAGARLVLQTDGNLVIRAKTTNVPHWDYRTGHVY